MNKFEHGFGTQLGAVLLWRRIRSGGLMLAAWSHQTTGGRKKTFCLGIQKGRYGYFVDKFENSALCEGTLGTFSVRFYGMFVLPCLAVLVPGAALATLLLAAAAAGELMGD